VRRAAFFRQLDGDGWWIKRTLEVREPPDCVSLHNSASCSFAPVLANVVGY